MRVKQTIPMRSWCCGMLVAVMAVVMGVPAVHASSLIPPFNATYTLKAGVMRGETSMSMRNDGSGTFLFESEIKPKGFVKLFARGQVKETSHFLYDQDGIRPIDYVRLDTLKDKNTNIQFDWENGVVKSTYKEESREEALSPGILDRQLVLFAFMHDLLNDTDQMSYTLIDRKGRLKTYEVSRLGEEEIKTPAGRFQTVKFQHRTLDSTRTTTFWCAPALHFLPARIEQRKDNDKPSRAELKTFEGL